MQFQLSRMNPKGEGDVVAGKCVQIPGVTVMPPLLPALEVTFARLAAAALMGAFRFMAEDLACILWGDCVCIANPEGPEPIIDPIAPMLLMPLIAPMFAMFPMPPMPPANPPTPIAPGMPPIPPICIDMRFGAAPGGGTGCGAPMPDTFG